MSSRLVANALALALALFAIIPTSLASKEEDDDFETHGFDPIVVILFMFFGLSVGILTMQILSRYGEAIPYTVVIFILGVLFSFICKTNDSGAFGESIKAWVHIDAELMLFIFLPPLIFGEAMSLNWHHIKGAFAPAVLLAGPGVLIGAALMGVISKYLLPYPWSWNLAMVFGSILSATDPVAVVALLKSAGASPQLTMLIVGESLLNDGTAMVLFTLFYKLLIGNTMDGGDIISFFFAAAIGSTVFGMACGLIVVRWLRSANRPLKETDTTIQIAITICSAYLIFFCAQYLMEVSGVLACCGAGAMISWLGPPIVLSHESMHNVWGIIEWMGNTLIFLLAGLIIGHRSVADVNAIDWLYALILFGILMAIRVFIVAVLFPFLSSKAHRFTLSEAAFVSWAGLRGALAMALALIVQNSNDSDVPSREASRVFFFVGIIATLTLIFNATFAKPVLNYLRLIDDNDIEKQLVVAQIKKRLTKKMNKVIEQLSEELRPQDLEEVRMSCSLLRESVMEEGFRPSQTIQSMHNKTSNNNNNNDDDDIGGGPIESKGLYSPVGDEETSMRISDSVLGPLIGFDKSILTHPDQQQPPQQQYRGVGIPRKFFGPSVGSARNNSRTKSFHDAEIDNRVQHVSRLLSMNHRGPSAMIVPDLLAYVRCIFLEIVRVKYWQHIDNGKLPRLSHSAQFLLYSVDVGIDEVRHEDGLQDWSCIKSSITSGPFYIKLLSFLDTNLPHWNCFSFFSKTLGRLEARQEKRIVYILTSFIDAHEHAQKKIHAFVGLEEDTPEEEHVSTPEEVKVKEESARAVADAKRMLDRISKETVYAIKTKQIARSVLSKEADLVKHMVEEGLLTPKHAEEFLEEISEDAARIEKERNRMYREQGLMKAQRRHADKFDSPKKRDGDLTATLIAASSD